MRSNREFAALSFSLRRLCTASLLAGCLVIGTAAAGPEPKPPEPKPPGPEPIRSAICQAQPGAAAVPATAAEWAAGAQLFDGLGEYHRAASTGSPEAQAYFDQGMRLLWAFNHDEATRSFAKAAELDPQCAICWWGVSLTVGPNYNLPMMAEPRAKVAWDALQKAREHAAGASPVEQALIGALAIRYRGPQPLDPSNSGPVLTAYALSVQHVAAAFSDDSDVQVMAAEAMMNINAWKLWSLDGTPAQGTVEIVSLLENALAKNPLHPGANHYLIHALEASPHPERAVAAAERLPGMMPAAGHLEHMPAHIFQRVGRYGKAADANRKGAAADVAYFARTRPLDYYAMYTAHNYQFLAFSTAMQGNKAKTIAAVRDARAAIPDEILLAMPGTDWSLTELYTGMIRFGMWDELLAEPAPNPTLAALTAGYRYARSVAWAAKGRTADAEAELAEFDKIAAAAAAGDGAGLNAAKNVYAVASLVAGARIMAARGKDGDATSLLEQAVQAEDRLAYDEPADWFVPSRHLLGAVLLKAGRASDAEAVYREDLRRHPDNGWALFGLAETLKAQGRTDEADNARSAFEQAWQDADVSLAASAF
jgi:tetratricopeptide (TPR) repeat protein